jgi:hypothetical protein
MTDTQLDDLIAAEVDPRWFKYPDKVRAFLLDQFCNKRTHLHLKTAGFWKYLIEDVLAKDEPAFRVLPAKKFRRWEYDPTAEFWDFDTHARLVLAAGGYSKLENNPVSNQNKKAAELFGLPTNSAKVTLFRLRREAEKFFERGGEYIPKKPSEPKVKNVDPLAYDLDIPLTLRPKWHGGPQYRMRQKSFELSSIIQEPGQDNDGVSSENWVDSQDEIIYYDHARFKNFLSRLPCPSPVRMNWEYPSFEDGFWTQQIVQVRQNERCPCGPRCRQYCCGKNDDLYEPGFMQAFESEYAFQSALQSCIADLAGKKRTEQDILKEIGELTTHDRSVLPMWEDKRTKSVTRKTQVDDLDTETSCEDEDPESAPRGFTITLSRFNCRIGGRIEHSRYGVGEILKLNGNIVLCRFSEVQANLSIGTIQRKTGINVKKEFRLREAILKVRSQRNLPPEMADVSFGLLATEKFAQNLEAPRNV